MGKRTKVYAQQNGVRKDRAVLTLACVNPTMTHFPPLALQIILPLVCNDTNHRRWPQVVAGDVVKHCGGFRGDVCMLAGQVKGNTVLPLPPQAEYAAEVSGTGHQ